MRQAIHPSAKPHLAAVHNYEPGKPIEELERELGIRHAIKLASNENALGPSPKALRAIRTNLRRIHRYPDGGSFYLRQKLAKLLGVEPDWLIFGNGSDEILVFAARTFLEKNDEVIIADPTFLIYEIASQVENARIVKIPIRNFRYDLGAMKRALTPRTKLVFIANPDNPVGTFQTQSELEAFLNGVPPHVLVVLDEAYYEFACGEKNYPRSLGLVRRFPNLLVTRTFSKAYGLSGLRVGYGIAHPSVIHALKKVREPFNVNLLAQVAACAALDDRAHLARTLRQTKQGRVFLETELECLGFRIVKTATNFVLADLRRPGRPVYEKLLRAGVIVRSMEAWGLANFIRITVGKRAENQRFIRALKQIVMIKGEMK